jgi:MFS family permease
VAANNPAPSPSVLVSNRILTPRFVVLWLIGFTSYASVYLLLPVIPLYLKEQGASMATIGTLGVGMMGLMALLVRPFSGWLSDAYGRKPLIGTGLAALLVHTLLLPFVGIGMLFAAFRALGGVGWGCLTSNTNTLAGEISPPTRRGEAIGHYTMSGSTALAIAPAAGLYLLNTRGAPAAFVVSAALLVPALVLAWFLAPPARAPLAPLRLTNLITTAALGPAAVVVVHATAYAGIVTFLPLLARERDLGEIGLFFTMYAGALVFLRGIGGRLSDRYGRPTVIVPGMVCASAAMLLLALATARWQMLLAALLFSVAMAFVQPPSLAWALDLGGSRRGTAMATMVAAQDTGIALGASALGLVGARGGFTALFGTAAGMAAFAAVILFILTRSKRLPALPVAAEAGR